MSPRPRQTREEKAESKRRLILEEALTVFAEKGYHGANIADIAQRLGMGHGTFYRYFLNKHDLFVGVLDVVLARVAEVIVGVPPMASNSLEEYRQQIQAIGHAFLGLYREDARFGELLFFEASIVDATVRDRVHQLMELVVAGIAEYLRNGVSKGFLRPDLDVTTAARAVNAMMLEACRHTMRAPDVVAASETWIATVSGIMLDGMRAR